MEILIAYDGLRALLWLAATFRSRTGVIPSDFTH